MSCCRAHQAHDTYRVVQLLPDTDRFVVRTSDDKVAMMTDRKSPHLAVMAF
jgi:hypothetical protein